MWKGDVLIADLEELETMEASEIYSNRLNAKEVIFHLKMENSYFQSPMDEHHPISARDQSRLLQFGKKVLPGFFLGMELFEGEFVKGIL